MGDPTRPTQPLPPGGEPPRSTVAAREREAVYAPDETLLEELRRVRFWSYFGSAVAVLASVLALIALVAALGEDDGEERDPASRAAVSAIRSDVSQLRSDVSEANTAADEATNQVQSLSRQVRRLDPSAATDELEEDIAQLQQELNDLGDRVDQVEQAQEDAASGGP